MSEKKILNNDIVSVSTGKLGVGTTSPDKKLEIKVSDTSSGTYYAQTVGGSSHLTGYAVGIGFDPEGYGDRNKVGIIVEGTGSGWSTGHMHFVSVGSTGTSTEAAISDANMTITSSGNVGIGTTSPAQKLHVAGKGLFTDFVRFNGVTAPDFPVDIDAVDGGKSLRSTRGTSIFRIDQSNDGPGYIGMQSDDDLSIQTNNTSKMYITSGGNVGIGTTSPTSTLQVAGQVLISATAPLLDFVDTNSFSDVNDRFRVRAGGNEGLIQWYDDSSSSLLSIMTFQPNGNVIVPNGNVGIGTTSPNATLHVNGGVHFGTDSTVLNPTNGQVLIETVSGGTPRLQMYVHGSSVFDINSDGTTANIGWGSGADREVNFQNTGAGDIKVGIGTGSPTRTLSVLSPNSSWEVASWKVNNGKQGNLYADTSGVGLYTGLSGFSTYVGSFFNEAAKAWDVRTNGAVRMIINSSGNVGIGTTSPGAKLNIATSSVWGTAVTEALTIDNTGSAGNVNTEHSLGRIRWRTNGVIGASIDAIRDTPGAGHNVDIAFSTNTGGSGTSAAERMRINYNGNVGIGTTSPQGKLQIGGGLVIDQLNDLVTNSAVSRIFTTDGQSGGIRPAQGFHLVLQTRSTASRDIILATGTTPTERLVVKGSGNVGIGTNSPDVPLEVVGSNTLRIHDGTDQGSIFFRGDRDDVYIKESNYQLLFGAPSGMVFELDTNTNDGDFFNVTHRNTSRFFIDGATGNVGIGTTSPSANLEVIDPVSGNFSGEIKVGGNGSSRRLLLKQDTVLEYLIGASGSGTLLKFGTGNGAAERMRITDSGNVGIGTATFPTTAIGEIELLVEGAVVTKPSGVNDYYSYLKSNWSNDGAFELGIQGVDTNHKLITTSNYYFGTQLNFHTSDQKRMVIDTNGNVGIGTTSPAPKLHLVYAGGSYGTDATSGFINQADTGRATMRLRSIADSASELFFDVDGGIRWDISARPSSQGHSLNFYPAASTPSYNNVAAHTLQLSQNGDVIVTGSGSSGKMGIGTTSPVYKLDVADAARIDGVRIGRDFSINNRATVRIDSNGDAPSDILFGHTAAANQSGWTGVHWSISARESGGGAAQGDKFTIWRGGGHASPNNSESQFLTITPDLKMGIGTTSPSEKLEVAGNDISALIYDSTDMTNDDESAILKLRHVASSESGNTFFSPSHPHAGINFEREWGAAGSTLSTLAKIHTYGESGWGGGLVFMTKPDDGISSSDPVNVLDLTPDGEALFSGNVGIGTTSPGARLDVRADAPSTSGSIIYVRNTSADGSNSTFGGISFFSNPGTDYSIGKLNTGSASALSFRNANNGTEYMRITSTGNVGIGTTSPLSELHVVGSARVVVNDSAGGDTLIGAILGVSNGYRILTNTSNEITYSWHTGDNVQALTINNNSNVGIGTTSPDKKLVVSDSTAKTAIGGSEVLRIAGTSQAVGRRNEIGFSPYDTNLNPHITLGMEYVSTAAYCSSDFYIATRALTTDTAPIERMRITSGGNVGIGTTSPDEKLSVVGNTGLYGTVSGGTVSPASLRFFTSEDGAGLSGSNKQKIGQITWAGKDTSSNATGEYAAIRTYVIDSNNIIQGSGGEGGQMEFSILRHDVGGSPRVEYTAMTINNAGNVGIGTTTPTQKLDVNGDIAVKGASVINKASAALTIGDTAGTDSVTNLTLTTAGGNTEVFLDDSGNVGINTATPSYNLTVNSGTNDIGILTASSDSGSYVGFLDNSTSTIPKIGAVGNKLVLDASQYVGVRRTDPSYALDVNGTIRATGNVIAYSDARVKENVETIPNALDKVKAMRGVGYNKIGEEKRSIGVIAQELLEVVPEAVHQDEKGMYSVAYGNLVGVLVEAMKEQQQQIDELKAKLDGITK